MRLTSKKRQLAAPPGNGNRLGDMAVAKWVAWCEGIWGFPKIEVSPKNGWFIGENAIKTDDLGGTPISEPPIYLHDTRELLG